MQPISSRCHDIPPSVTIGKIWAKKVLKAACKLEDQYLDQFGWKLSEYTQIGKQCTKTVQVFRLILAIKRQSDHINNKDIANSIDTNHSSA